MDDSLFDLDIGCKELSAEEFADFQEAYLMLRSADDTLDIVNLELLLRLIGLNPTCGVGSDLESIPRKLHSRGTHSLTYEQVLLVTKRAKFATPTYSDLLAVATAFDTDEDGYLTLMEVKNLLFYSGEIMSELDMYDILEACAGGDATGVERVRVEDFVKAAYNYADDGYIV